MPIGRVRRVETRHEGLDELGRFDHGLVLADHSLSELLFEVRGICAEERGIEISSPGLPLTVET